MLFGGTQHQGDAEYLGEEANNLHGVPMQINKTVRRALHIESPMQEAVIEYVRRVSKHCSYDALERQGAIAAEL